MIDDPLEPLFDPMWEVRGHIAPRSLKYLGACMCGKSGKKETDAFPRYVINSNLFCAFSSCSVANRVVKTRWYELTTNPGRD